MYHDTDSGENIVRTIRLRDADLAAVSQLLDQLVGSSTVLSVRSIAALDTDSVDSRRETLMRLARRIAVVRRGRAQFFSKAMFSEPAWDMLLWLYVSSATGPRLSVGRLTKMSGAPPTTALRWLDYLEKEKLVRREENPTDRRSEFVSLSEKGRSVLEAYLSETLKTLA